MGSTMTRIGYALLTADQFIIPATITTREAESPILAAPAGVV